jgi:hypothetical protein
MSKMDTVEDIDGKILDLVQLYRLMWPDFNSHPVVERVYHANGKLADALDKGWIE